MIIEYQKELNKEQLEAVTTINGPLLIIAGAGTGKTRTIVYRAAYILEQGASSNEILMLTFTNKAADEMKQRVSDLLGSDVASGITACTFHSFCVKMLRYYAEYVGMNPLFTVLSAGDDVDLINMEKAKTENKRKYDKEGFPPSAKIAEIISRAVNKSITIMDVLNEKKYQKYLEFHDDIVEIKELVDKYKKDNALLNYDDLLLEMNRMLLENPKIAEKISRTYTYVMVDEYQDTNMLQDEILQRICVVNKNLAVVGDDMQSLYAFRGAEVKNIINFPKRVPGCRIVKLVRNYRSNQEILDLANYAVQSATEGYPKELVGLYSSGEKPIIYSTLDQQQEVYDVLDLMEDLRINGYKYEDICVLARNSFLTAMVEANMTRQGIPYVKFGGPKFLDTEYVKTVLSYLRVIARQTDEIAWFRILKVHPGIGDHNAKKLASECKEFGVEHLIDVKYKKRVFADELVKLHDGLLHMISLDFQDVVSSAIDFYVKTEKSRIRSMRVSNEGRRTELVEEVDMHYEQLQMLVNIATNYNTITSFLDDLILDSTDATQVHSEEGSVTVSTIHSIKGLEYKAVIIVDCIDGIFPATEEESIGSEEDNEELRCFYVAVTRAKEKLYLMCPQFVKKYGKSLYGRVPHYLNGGNQYYNFIK